MRIASKLASLFILILLGSAASAVPVSVKFTGSVAEIDTRFSTSDFQVGHTVVTEFLFDDAQTGHNFDPFDLTPDAGFSYTFDGGSIHNLDLGKRVLFDPQTLGSTGIVSLYRGGCQVFGFSARLGAGSVSTDVAGFDCTNQAFASQSLPDLLSGISNFKGFSPQIWGLSTRAGDSFLGTCGSFCNLFLDLSVVEINTVTAVPAPAALPLMMLGFAGLGFAGRLKRRIT